MNRYQTILFGGFIALYLPALGLYHWMVFRVNQRLPPDRRIPHSLYWGGWNRLRNEFERFYPSSPLYQIALTLTATCLIIAVLFAGFSILQYAIGK